MLFRLERLPDTEILLNRGCGINYLQRRQKVPFGEIPQDVWFFKEKLSDKIAIDISWSMLEPEEGKFIWDQPEWEGCFQSWIDAGFKVLLKVRGMDTLGTFYNQGTPQWVFDAGAQYVDEPIEFYRNTWLLNEIPGDTSMPIRYPVYWDPVYMEKASNLIHALGERYNGKPYVESFAIAHTGRWGEMHIADHYPRDEWDRKGYTLPRFLEAHRQMIDIYRDAFSDTPLQQSLGDPSFQDTTLDAMENFEYLAKCGVMQKFGGLGMSWHNPTYSRWMDDVWIDIFRRFKYQSKVVFENLVMPEALELALELGTSYWQRGGEAPGLGELNIDKDIPIPQKRIYSGYKFHSEEFDSLTLEQQMNAWRRMAQKTGYRLSAESVDVERDANILHTEFVWTNTGAAPCYEPFKVCLALCNSNGNIVWSDKQSPACGCGAKVWDNGVRIADKLTWNLPSLPSGEYKLMFGLELCNFAHERMQLANYGRIESGVYPAGKINIAD